MQEVNIKERDEIEQLIIRQQKSYGTQLTISLTNRCPLKCEHCIVNANDFNGNDLDINTITDIGKQLQNLQGRIKLISITGGEPFLREAELKALLKSAHPWFEVGIVTSGYWAYTPDEAVSLIKSYPEISHYNISTDLYHIRYVGLDQIRNAYIAAKNLQKAVVIRFTQGYDSSAKEMELLNDIKSFAGKDIAVQNLVPFGRAEQLTKKFPYTKKKPPVPCVSDGPLIREDGIVLPCCSALASLKNTHPLISGSIRQNTLTKIYQKIDTNPVFQFLRLWGSGGLYELLKDTSYSDILPRRHLDFNPCYTCAQLFSKPEIGHYLTQMALDTEFKLKVASGLWYFLQESTFIEELFQDENYRLEVVAKCK